MQQLTEFVTHHPILFTVLGLILLALLANEWLIVRRGGTRLSAADAVRLINDRDAQVIDLRAVADYKRGHILNAVNVPLAKLDEHLPQLRKHPERPVLLYCALGSVSLQAGAKLRAAGLTEVFPLVGGINAWQSAGLPLTASKATAKPAAKKAGTADKALSGPKGKKNG